MTTGTASARMQRTVALLLFAAAFVSMASLHHPRAGWGVKSRLALVFAIVDQRTFTIDSYHEHPALATGDKAEFDGHFYSDKIIGVSLLAVPAYAALRAAGQPFGWRPSFRLSYYTMRLFAVSLPAAISVACLWLLFVQLGAPPRESVYAVALTFWGSMWFGFSTAFFPYAPGIAALCCALLLMLTKPPRPMRDSIVGFLCGFSILCDMIFGLIVLGFIGVYLTQLLRHHRIAGRAQSAPEPPGRTQWMAAATSAACGAAGGAIPLLIFGAYVYSIFGTLSIPYEYGYVREFRSFMSEGVMGVTTPKLAALWHLTLHPYRGLFFWSPWVPIAIAGLVAAARTSGANRTIGWLGLYCVLAYFLFNASYYMWWGGWAMGPRFLLPLFAIVPLGLAEWLRPGRHRAWRFAIYAFGALAVGLSLPLSILDPETPMINEASVLLDIKLSSPIMVPQFEYLSRFYSPEFWVREDGSLRAARSLSMLATIFVPLALLAAAARTSRPGSTDSTSQEQHQTIRP